MNSKTESNLETLKHTVRQKFAEILAAVQMREKLLLRQLDVIATSQLQQSVGRSSVTSTTQTGATASEIKFLAEQEAELLGTIRSFGRFQLDNMNLALHDVYLKNEDYIEPTDDHETMYKCLPEAKINSNSTNVGDANAESCEITYSKEEQPEAIVVDFSRNKSLVEQSRKLMNKSIINITLQEAKELIRKAKIKREAYIPPLNLEELDDEMESSIADALSSLEYRDVTTPIVLENHKNAQTKKFAEQAEATTTTASADATTATKTTTAIPKKSKTKRCKPKITINNCNGTINLRNISSLTINCASEEAISAEIPLQVPTDDDEDDEVEEAGEHKLYARSATPSKAANKTKRSNKTTPAATVKSVKKVLECIVDSSSGNTESTTPTTTASSSTYSSNASSRSQSKKLNKNQKQQQQHNTAKSMSSSAAGAGHSVYNNTSYSDVVFADVDDENINNATCDFYNRLLNEIKNNIKDKPRRCYKYLTTTNAAPAAETLDDGTHFRTTAEADSTSVNADNSKISTAASNTSNHSCNVSSSSATQNSTQSHTTQQAGKRLILKNFENLKIILEANSGDEDAFHPVQIEQWLAEIISETDLEPMPNTDILEHSKLHSVNVVDDADDGVDAADHVVSQDVT